jgi:hypothetical protein
MGISPIFFLGNGDIRKLMPPKMANRGGSGRKRIYPGHIGPTQKAFFPSGLGALNFDSDFFHKKPVFPQIKGNGFFILFCLQCTYTEIIRKSLNATTYCNILF